MKKILILVLTLSMVSTLGAQDQWSLVTKRTAAWCGNCGSWGWNAFEGLVEGLEDENAIVVAMHTENSDLTNDVSKDLLANIGGNGQPRIYLNMDNYNFLSSNYTEKVASTISDLQLLNSFGGVIDVDLTVVEELNGTLTVDANVEAFDALTGEYRLGLYVIQDHVIANQASQGANADHRNLLTASFYENSFGELIGTGTMNSGDIISFNTNMPLPAGYDKENTKIAAMIWRPLASGQYIFINGNWTNEITLATTSTKDLSDQFSNLNVFQKAQSAIEIRFDALESMNDLNLALVNQQGAKIHSIKRNAVEGFNQYQMDVDQLSSGIYVLSIQHENERISKQFVVIK